MAVYTAIDDAGSFFNPKLWVGSTSSNVITGVGFQPDLLWIKDRDSTAYHVLTDAVRGTDSQIYSNSSSAEGTLSTVVTSFDSGGFTISGSYPNDGNDYVTWCWKAGTTTGIAGSPSITPSSYSFNATSGFSIIKYVGTGANATLPHGLGVAPGMIIFKNLPVAENWIVYHEGIGPTKYLHLDLADAAGTQTAMFNDTAPTADLFTVGTSASLNQSTKAHIAYCFAPVQGYSAFGSYTGNANADGPFVYTGFRPAFVLLKRAGPGADAWAILDDKRLGYNAANYPLFPNSSEAAASTIIADILSNGFKIRASSTSYNGSGNTNVYAAFAESPFVNSEGVPVNAR